MTIRGRAGWEVYTVQNIPGSESSWRFSVTYFYGGGGGGLMDIIMQEKRGGHLAEIHGYTSSVKKVNFKAARRLKLVF